MHIAQDLELPVGSMGRHAGGWWGMIMLISTEGALFGHLLFAYYYLAVQHSRDWLPPVLPGWSWSIPESVVLLASAGVVWVAERRLQEGPAIPSSRSCSWLRPCSGSLSSCSRCSTG
jgi:heme/copper-type cytochrome/quinol oxidase subunit 3